MAKDEAVFHIINQEQEIVEKVKRSSQENYKNKCKTLLTKNYRMYCACQSPDYPQELEYGFRSNNAIYPLSNEMQEFHKNSCPNSIAYQNNNRYNKGMEIEVRGQESITTFCVEGFPIRGQYTQEVKRQEKVGRVSTEREQTGKLSVASMIKNILMSEYEKYSRNVGEKYGNENTLDGFMKFLWGRLRSVYIKGYNVAVRDLTVEEDGIAFCYGLIDGIQSHTRKNKDDKEVTEYILLHEGREVKIREAAVYNAALQEFEDTFHLRLANCLERGLRILWAGFRRKYRRSSATYIFELHFVLLSHTGMLAESSYEIQMYDYINNFININGLKARGVQFYKPFRFGYSVYRCMDCDRDFLEDGLIRIKDVDTEYVVEVFGMENVDYLDRKQAKEGVFSANSNFRLMRWDVLNDESIHVIDNLLYEVKECALNAKEE